jgi:hypothetical protein
VTPSSDLAAPASLVSLWKVKSRKIDTVEVWGSSPHVPTILSIGIERIPKIL